MLVILPFCARDKSLAVRLAGWIAELGGVKAHDCLLAVHKDADSAEVIEPLTKAFGRIAEFAITDEMIVEREQYVYAANMMWKRTLNHVADMGEPMPWLWMEPDATPISADWLDRLAAEYKAKGRPFLHDLVITARGKSNSGCGIYPAAVRDYTDRLWQLSNVSWDVLLYNDFAEHTAYTPLIQDIGFMPGTTDVLPTFRDAGALDALRPGAVLFHRCRDGSLIDRLRERAGTPSLRKAVQESLSHPPVEDRAALLSRISELEAKLSALEASKVPRAAAPRVMTFSPKKRKFLDARTPEQIAAAKARMAKARAGRKVAA